MEEGFHIDGRLLQLLKEALQIAVRTYGKVCKATPAVINGSKGFLIWDYILFNELTFLNQENGMIVSLFTSSSDEETEKRFNHFAEKYGS